MTAVTKLRIVVCTPQYYVHNNGFLTYLHTFLFYELGKYTLKGMNLRIQWRVWALVPTFLGLRQSASVRI